jgi:hypothetical protein
VSFGEQDEVNWLKGTKAKLRAAAGKGPSRNRAGREPVTSVAKVESDRARKDSRRKGNRGELEVAEMFSRWCGEVVRRTPMSGGWSNARFGVTGDLVCDNPAFPYHVEVKLREGWVLDDLVTGVRREHDKSIVQWWKQCFESCPRKEDKLNRIDNRGRFTLLKEPLLVFRRNRQPWLAMMRSDVGRALFDGHGEWCNAYFALPYAPACEVGVMLLDRFLGHVPVPRGLSNHGKVET